MVNLPPASTVMQQLAKATLYRKVKVLLQGRPTSIRVIPRQNSPMGVLRSDFYSEDHRIVGMIYTKSSLSPEVQDSKISDGIFSTRLPEDTTGTPHRKIIAVFDPAAIEDLEKDPYLKDYPGQSDIETMYFDIRQELHEMMHHLRDAQRMQRTKKPGQH